MKSIKKAMTPERAIALKGASGRQSAYDFSTRIDGSMSERYPAWKNRW